MPRPSKKKQYIEKDRRSIYLILNPYTKEFYIDYTLTKNIRQLYIEHCLGNRNKTRDMVFMLQEKGARPCCFNLCELNCTKVEAYRAVIGWTKVFVERGYINVDQGNIECYINDIFGEAKTHYESNKHINIDQKFNCNNCLFPTYKRKKCEMKARDGNATN